MFLAHCVGLERGYTEMGGLSNTRTLRKHCINENSFLRSHSISTGGERTLILFEMKFVKWIMLFGTREKLITVTQQVPCKSLMITV